MGPIYVSIYLSIYLMLTAAGATVAHRLHGCHSVMLPWDCLRTVTALGTMPETCWCRYVFDGKPPKAKSEEISRR